MSAAFHSLTTSGCLSYDAGGIIPPPIVLGVTEVIVDGKVETVTATSGALQYVIVRPGDFPLDQMARERRRGVI